MKVGLVSNEDPEISEFEMDGVFGLGILCQCAYTIRPAYSDCDLL